MRGSQAASARLIRSWIWRRVVVVFGSNRNGSRPGPEVGQPQPLARLGHQHDPDRLAHVRARPPTRRPGRPRPTRGGKPMPRPRTSPRRPLSPLPGSAIGKQIRRNGIHQKTMFSRPTKIISTISAQIVMIGIENEQIMPEVEASPGAELAVMTVFEVRRPGSSARAARSRSGSRRSCGTCAGPRCGVDRQRDADRPRPARRGRRRRDRERLARVADDVGLQRAALRPPVDAAERRTAPRRAGRASAPRRTRRRLRRARRRASCVGGRQGGLDAAQRREPGESDGCPRGRRGRRDRSAARPRSRAARPSRRQAPSATRGAARSAVERVEERRRARGSAAPAGRCDATDRGPERGHVRPQEARARSSSTNRDASTELGRP